jgi:hypothetical protein
VHTFGGSKPQLNPGTLVSNPPVPAQVLPALCCFDNPL